MLDIPHVLLLFAIVLSYFIGITIYSLIAYVASLIYYKSGWFECNVCFILNFVTPGAVILFR